MLCWLAGRTLAGQWNKRAELGSRLDSAVTPSAYSFVHTPLQPQDNGSEHPHRVCISARADETPAVVAELERGVAANGLQVCGGVGGWSTAVFGWLPGRALLLSRNADVRGKPRPAG